MKNNIEFVNIHIYHKESKKKKKKKWLKMIIYIYIYIYIYIKEVNHLINLFREKKILYKINIWRIW